MKPPWGGMPPWGHTTLGPPVPAAPRLRANAATPRWSVGTHHFGQATFDQATLDTPLCGVPIEFALVPAAQNVNVGKAREMGSLSFAVLRAPQISAETAAPQFGNCL